LDQSGYAEEALANATKGKILDERTDYLLVRRCWNYFAFMGVHLSRSNFSEAEETIQKMRSLARESHAPDWVARQAEMWQARVWLAKDRLDLAIRWMDRGDLRIANFPDELDFFRLQEYMVAARVLIGQERLAEAGDLLARLHAFAKTNGLVARDVEVLCLSALALQAAGNMEEAMDTIECALSIAEKGGFIRIFVDEGTQMARLLYEAATRGISAGYVRTLLSAFPFPESQEAKRPHVQAANTELLEPLSDRELEVLRLIAEGFTNQEIGERLFISLHTVKSHARNIFAKLDTRSRTAAVNKARGLGLLPPL
jgi:LuxR family maltose regulon positive regulatory protein